MIRLSIIIKTENNKIVYHMGEMAMDSWRQRVDSAEAAKTHTKDMSKLFYVYHDSVREIMSTPKPSSPRIREVSGEIAHILKGTQNLNDPFVATLARENNIKSFQNSFKDLSSMLRSTVKLNQQKQIVQGLIRSRAFSSTEFKNFKHLNNITEEIKDSAKRLNSVKAGQPLQKVIRQPLSKSASIHRVPSLSEWRQKKKEMQDMIKGLVVKKSAVNCKILGKSERLGDYFAKKIEFANLCLGHQPPMEPKGIWLPVYASEEITKKPHFMTELNVKINTIEKPLVRTNVDKIVEIVNQKLKSDRKSKDLEKSQKLREIELTRMAEPADRSIRNQKSMYRPNKVEQKVQSDRKMASTYTSSLFDRPINLQNTIYSQDHYDDLQIVHKLSSLRF